MNKVNSFMCKIFLLAIIVLGICHISTADDVEYAKLNQVPLVAPKSSAMGEAFVAVADDAYAVFFNPAGLSQLKHPRLTLSYFNIYNSVSEGFISGIYPLESPHNVAFGLSYLHFGSPFYKENTYILSVSASPYCKGLAIGGNIKRFGIGVDSADEIMGEMADEAWFDKSDPLFGKDGISCNAFTLFDIGALYRANKNLQFGVCCNNLGNTKRKWLTDDDDGEKVSHYVVLPKTLRIGAAYFGQRKYDLPENSPKGEKNPGWARFTASGEFLRDFDNGNRKYLGIGGELLFVASSSDTYSADFALRGGMTVRNKLVQDGTKLGLSGGFCIRYLYSDNYGVILDYAITNAPIDSSHRVSLSLVGNIDRKEPTIESVSGIPKQKD